MVDRNDWTDVALDREFQAIRDQLEALRALPAQIAQFDIRLGNQNDHLMAVARDLREDRGRADQRDRDLGAIRVELAKVATQLKVWAMLGGLIAGGVVSAAVTLLPHS